MLKMMLKLELWQIKLEVIKYVLEFYVFCSDEHLLSSTLQR